MDNRLQKGLQPVKGIALVCSITLALFVPARCLYATVVGWGTNDFGETTIPSGLVGAKAIAAGYWHNLAITSSSNVVAWGLDDYGQTNVPLGLANVIAVAAGENHSLALQKNGTVAGWGDNTYNQIDIPSDLTSGVSFATAIAAGAFHSAALRSDGTVECWGYDFYGEADPPTDLTNATAIACGNSFSLALLSDGTVVGWGDDYYGQIDIPSDLTNVVAIAAGGFHALALNADGSVEAWGATNANSDAINYGQAIVPSDLTNAMAIAGGYLHSMALRSDGVVEQWGDTSLGETNPPPNLSPVLAVAGGYGDSLALENDKPTILTQPQNVTTNKGKTVQFVLTATGMLPLTNRWWLVNSTNNTAVTSTAVTSDGVVTSTLTISSGSNNASYFGVVSNAAGVVTSSVVSLTISVPPTITNQPQNVITNPGANVYFTVVAGGNQPLNYLWLHNGVDSGAGSVNPLELDNVTTNNNGNYQVIITNNYGAVTSQVAVLTVGDSPAITSQPTSQTVIQGSNATFVVVAAGAEPLSYQWWFNQTNALTVATNPYYTVNSAQTNNAGSYGVVISNALGSVTSSVATLTVLVPPTILTQPQNVTTNKGKTVRFVLTATGMLPLTNRWWLVNSTNNTAVTSTAVTSDGVVTSTLTISSGLNNASYFGVVSNAAGVVTSSVVSLTISVPPTITNQPQNVITNSGAKVYFTVVAGGNQPLNYLWLHNGVDSGAGSVNPLELDNVTTNNNGNYQVIITNNYGAVTSQVATLVVAYQSLTPAQLWFLFHSSIYGDALQIALEAGKNYRVQSSTDLQTWMDVTNFLSASTLVEYTNALATNTLPQIYYRVVSP